MRAQNNLIEGVGITHSPSAVVFNGKIYAFHHGSNDNGELWYKVWAEGAGWQTDERVQRNKKIFGSPSAVVWKEQIFVFFESGEQQGQLRFNVMNRDGQWKGEDILEGVESSGAPNAILFQDRITVYHNSKNPGRLAHFEMEF